MSSNGRDANQSIDGEIIQYLEFAFKCCSDGSSHCGLVVTHPISIHEDEGLNSGLAQ